MTRETPPPPTPTETTDWTFVLRAPCAQCGFDAAATDRADIADRIRATIPRWQEVLTRRGRQLTQRPEPTVWSTLEYCCHVRDVALVFAGRLDLMLRRSDPSLVSWDQDEAAARGRYWDEKSKAVSRGYVTAAGDLAAAFDGVTGERWERPGRRSDGSAFTVETLGLYSLHDLEHHLVDVRG